MKGIEVFNVGKRPSHMAYERGVKRAEIQTFRARHIDYVLAEGPVSAEPMVPKGSIRFNQLVSPKIN